MSVDSIPTNTAAREYVKMTLQAVLIEAITELSKVKPEHPTQWLANYLLTHNPNKPRMGPSTRA